MNYADLKIGKLVQTVLKPLIIRKASSYEVLQMQELEYSKKTFGIQYPLLLKTSSSVTEKHYYSELLTLYGETYRLCCEWYETAANNDRPYVENWIREHEDVAAYEFEKVENVQNQDDKVDFDWDELFGETKKEVEILPKDGMDIGFEQYKGREDLTVVEIRDGVKSIGNGAFIDCKNLKEIIIPDSVAYIDGYAFSNCFNLENVHLPENLRYIGEVAFSNCRCLQKINIPRLITVIPTGCFYGCTNLKEVSGGSEIRVIMEYAFGDCENLSTFSLYWCDKLSVIYPCAFRGCKNLVFETIDQKVFIGDCYRPGGSKISVMMDKDAFDWNSLTLRTFKGTDGDKLAQKMGFKVEHVRDER